MLEISADAWSLDAHVIMSWSCVTHAMWHKTSLTLVLSNLRRPVKLVLTRPRTSVVQISIGISRKQKKCSFSLNVILKRFHSCFRPVKRKDTDTFKCRSVCCTECWYNAPVEKLGLRIDKLFSYCVVEHFNSSYVTTSPEKKIKEQQAVKFVSTRWSAGLSNVHSIPRLKVSLVALYVVAKDNF